MKHAVKITLNRPKERYSAVRFRVSWGGGRLDLYAGITVETAIWDAVTCRVDSRYGNKEAISANKRIAEAVVFLNDIFDRYLVLEKRQPSVEELRREFLRFSGKEPEVESDFFQSLHKFIAQMSARNEWGDATVKKFHSLERLILSWRPDLTLNEVDENVLQDFVLYLNKRGYHNTTTYKNLALFKWFLRWAAHSQLIKPDKFDEFKPKIKGYDGSLKTIVYLEWDELMRLYEMDVVEINSLSGLEVTRDLFCLCCFTGLRYSDAVRLRRSDVHDGFISVVTKKTNDPLRIELNRYSSAILKKYEGVDLPGGVAIPSITNQAANYNLKILAQRAGIDTPTRVVYFVGNSRREHVFPKYALVTTHAARRTFVVAALRMEIPSEVVMKWTGHSDFKAMRPYIAIVDKMKEEQMRKFDKGPI